MTRKAATLGQVISMLRRQKKPTKEECEFLLEWIGLVNEIPEQTYRRGYEQGVQAVAHALHERLDATTLKKVEEFVGDIDAWRHNRLFDEPPQLWRYLENTCPGT